MLTRNEVRVTMVRPLADPEPIAAAIDRIGVIVNQITHWANTSQAITPEQLDEATAAFRQVGGSSTSCWTNGTRPSKRPDDGRDRTGQDRQPDADGSPRSVIRAVGYIIDGEKTMRGALVESNYETDGTDPDRLGLPMIENDRNAPKGITRNSRLAYHIKMSFSPDDPVDARRAHELGMEFARRITGGDYKFIVATHTDRVHRPASEGGTAQGRHRPMAANQRRDLPKLEPERHRITPADHAKCAFRNRRTDNGTVHRKPSGLHQFPRRPTDQRFRHTGLRHPLLHCRLRAPAAPLIPAGQRNQHQLRRHSLTGSLTQRP